MAEILSFVSENSVPRNWRGTPNPRQKIGVNMGAPIIKYIYILVGGIPTHLKNVNSSVGMVTFPTEWKVIKFMCQTTNQISILSKEV
jgi:hypothetical protein